MVTKRLPVNVKRVNWYDSQRVTADELQDEQDRNIGIDAANVANFFGSGVVQDAAIARVILDTNNLNTTQQTLFDGYSFDGSNIYVGTPLETVTDTTQGVQLSVTLSNVRLDGVASTRVLIIGDEFGGELIHDELTFETNCTKITRNRYKSLRAILFNDFAGNLRGSQSYALEQDGYDLVGRCIIRETESLEVSPDTTVAAQIQQPSRFFYNFQPASGSTTLSELLESVVGADKSAADLNIGFDSVSQRQLVANDVTTRFGQKFQATGTNIQKISILLSVQESLIDGYDWSGSIVLTLHALQTEVDCPVSPTPDNAIDFDPDPAIIAQLSLDSDDLLKQGIVLDGYPQVVNFIFTGSKISDPIRSSIEEDQFYVFTIGREGDAHTGILLLEEASDRIDNSYMVYFNGVDWTNITESDMWFDIQGDYIKIADGIAYEDGVGLQVPRIAKDSTNTDAPYIEGDHSFYTTTYDAYNYILIEQSDSFSDEEQHQRTGDLVYSRVAPIPSISLLTQSNFVQLLISDPAPVLLARAKDTNPRGNPEEITGTSTFIGLGYGNEFNILLPDADVRSFNWVGSLLTPNSLASYQYRIISATLIADSYGDVDGDGEITLTDLGLAQDLDGYSLSNPVTQAHIAAGNIDMMQFLRADVNGDGTVDATDIALIYNYVNRIEPSTPAGNTFSRMHLVVESISNPKTTTVNMHLSDTALVTTSGLAWDIEYVPTWIPDLVNIEDLRRLMPTTFVDPATTTSPRGQNNFYVPGNLLLDGYVLNVDNTFHVLDFEMTHLSLDIPVIDSYGNPTFLDGYSGILLFDNFVAESSAGLTASGFPAMKYSDGTYVQLADFVNGKVKISPTIQSTASTFSLPFGGSVNDIVGLYYDPLTSLMMLYVDNLYDDGYGNILTPTSTKILVSVYLKKAGFANSTREITEAQIRALFEI